MNFKTTLVLLILVAVAGGIWLLTPEPEKQLSPREQRTARNEARRLLSDAPAVADVQRVSLTRVDAADLAFERTEDGWQMTEPVQATAERHKVESLARRMLNLMSEYEAEDVTAADAGLTTPRAVVTLVADVSPDEPAEAQDDAQSDTADAEPPETTQRTLTFQVGDRVVLSRNTYVRLGDDRPIHVVSGDLSDLVEEQTDNYRSKTLTQFRPANVDEVRFEHLGRTYLLKRGVDDTWMFAEPLSAFADKKKVDDALTSLSRLRAKEFVSGPDSPGTYGMTDPFLHAVVWTEGSETLSAAATTAPVRTKHEIVVGGFSDMARENRYVRTEGQPGVAIVAANTINAFVPSLGEWRESRVTRIDPDDIQRIALKAESLEAELRKVDGAWQGEGDFADLDQQAVRNLLEAVRDLNAVEFIDDPEGPDRYGLRPARAEVALTTGDGATFTLRVGKTTPSGRNAYLRVVGQETVIVVPEAQAGRLILSPLELRSRDIFTLQPEAIRRIVLQQAGRRRVVERGLDDQWQLTDPEGAPLDPASIRELVNTLAYLRADAVVAKGGGERYGLDDPRVTVRLTVQQGDRAEEMISREILLEVAQRGGPVHARTSESPYVFQLERTVLDVLQQELISRALFDFEAGAVQAIEIVGNAGTLALVKDGDQWTFPADETVQLSQKRVRDFVSKVALFRVTEYLQWSGADLDAVGLADAPVTVTISLTDERTVTLHIDQRRRGELPRKTAWVEKQRVFLMRPADVELLLQGLDAYLKPARTEIPGEEVDLPVRPGGGQP